MKVLSGFPRKNRKFRVPFRKPCRPDLSLKILAKQNPGGFWDKEKDFYDHKYKERSGTSSYWQIWGWTAWTFKHHPGPNSF